MDVTLNNSLAFLLKQRVKSYLRWVYIKHLCYFRVQLLDIGKTLDSTRGASVRQLRVEHQFGP